VILRDVEVEGERVDVRVADGVIVEIGCVPGEDVDEHGGGGALIPGLHDHHLHLMAIAAAESSVDVSRGLEALRDAPGEGWVRAVGWSGEGDRRDLDAVEAYRPVRVQHRSGALWVVNSAGAVALGLADVDLPGVEKDPVSGPTGRLWRLDGWLADRLGRTTPPLAAVGQLLAGYGITGVTDATPDLDRETCALLRSLVPQRLQLLGDPDGSAPVKVILPDHDLPALDDLVARIEGIRPRPVAVHCVTREAYVLLLTSLDVVGHVAGDRIEHGAVIPADLLPPCPVVTQPGFLLDRGDDYLRDVDPRDLPELYRYASLPCALPSSDAPYGPLDPWQVMAAARDRRTPSGATVNASESVTPDDVLEGMLRPLNDLTGPARRVVVGAPADLVLLHVPLGEAMLNPSADLVRCTWIGGQIA
jgi:predicted amidohydrolase YtcJ